MIRKVDALKPCGLSRSLLFAARCDIFAISFEAPSLSCPRPVALITRRALPSCLSPALASEKALPGIAHGIAHEFPHDHLQHRHLLPTKRSEEHTSELQSLR